MRECHDVNQARPPWLILESRQNGLNRWFPNAFLVLLKTGQPVGFVLGHRLLEGFDDLLLEANQHDLFGLQFALSDLLDQVGNDFLAALHLHEDFPALRNGGEHLRDGGNPRAFELFVFPGTNVQFSKFFQGRSAHGQIPVRQALGGTIVNTNDLVILGQQKVSFDRIRSLLPCQLEGRQGILGGVEWEASDGQRSKVSTKLRGKGKECSRLKRMRVSCLQRIEHGQILGQGLQRHLSA